jgi:hypothetical protein
VSLQYNGGSYRAGAALMVFVPLVLGLLVGMAFGFVSQRGRF